MKMTKQELENFLSEVEIVKPERVEEIRWDITETWLNSQNCTCLKVKCPECGYFILFYKEVWCNFCEGKIKVYDYCGDCGAQMIFRR